MSIYLASDWSYYPSAVVHYETRNKSFLNVSALLREMGCKNHAFPLALINSKLRHVNPHDPALTLEQQAMVVAECRINKWYFMREVAMAPPEGTGEPSMIEANRGNIAMWFLSGMHATAAIEMIRQTGKSFACYLDKVWQLSGASLSSQIGWISKDDQLRRNTITKMKEIFDELPRYMDFRTREDAQNGEEITVKALGNHFITFVPNASEKRALNQGRGFTMNTLVADELPFQVNCHISLSVALSAMQAAIDRAKAANAPYGILIPTTAGVLDTPEGQFVHDMFQSFMPWSESLYDAESPAQLEEIVRKNSRTGEYAVYISLNHKQLGKTDKWLKETLLRTRSTGDQADRDFFNKWTNGSALSPFDPAVMEVMRNSVIEPDHTQITKCAYAIRWYKSEKEIEWLITNRRTIASVDSSDAAGSDECCLTITDTVTGETLGTAAINETNLILFAEFLCNLIIRYDKLTMIIERRSSGVMIIDYLLYMLPANGIDPFKRLFNTCVQDAELDRDRLTEISVPMGRRDPDCLIRYKKTFGFATSGSGMAARGELYGSTLQAVVKQVGSKMHDKKLVDQTLALQVKNGRLDHPKGGKDDAVISWLLGHWFLKNGKNLQFYGIDTAQVYRDIRPEATMTPQELYQHQQQQAVRLQITQIVEQLGEESDEMIIIKLEAQLKQLTRRVVVDENEVFSVDELIRKTRETRQQRRRTRGLYGSPSTPYSTGGLGVNRLAEDRVAASAARTSTISGHFQNADNPTPYTAPRRPTRW